MFSVLAVPVSIEERTIAKIFPISTIESGGLSNKAGSSQPFENASDSVVMEKEPEEGM
jgi:hypothetical protein